MSSSSTTLRDPVPKAEYKTYLKTLNRVTMQVFAAMVAERNDLAKRYNELVKAHNETLKESKKPYDGVSKVDELSMSQVMIGMGVDNVSIPFVSFMKDQTANLVGILTRTRKDGGLVSGSGKKFAKVVNIHTGDRASEVFAGLRDVLSDIGVRGKELSDIEAANDEIDSRSAFSNAYLSALLSKVSTLSKNAIRGDDVQDPRGLIVLPSGLKSPKKGVQNVHFTKKFVDAVLGSGAFDEYRRERIADLEAKIAATSNADTKAKLRSSLDNLKSDDGKRYLAFLQTLQLLQKSARHENYEELSKLTKAAKHDAKRAALRAPLDAISGVALPKQRSVVSAADAAKPRSSGKK